ncbi:MAG: 50S ribosomal protein L29 [Spirochaetales bacterium]|jgi:large subunit ribosomal protein L29|nr:50S ribosomal protein L29 [Spirochaetales bacterium]MBQ3698109.1 50S ribosomal protein L29 [Spirochaetales bacterium]MBQ3727907.1 50S ribosomal protein L29 [Spirochaetales bacterium]MBQ3829990.1 50S ribosomal protein L29 [Spirochaetales bacterium]MBQ6123976.1 50S ribosomal protein L29 [Spirochaetales bacterium]
MKNSFAKLSYNELVAKRDELRKSYLNMRMEKVLGHVENPLQVRNIRRQIARLNTLIHEYTLGIRKAN